MSFKYISADDNVTASVDHGLETLLLLDGEIHDQADGYWIKIEVTQATPGVHIPHGIRYSLTLHDRYGTRLLGYANAHGIKSPKKRYSGGRLAYDHRHRHSRDKDVAYEFVDAGQLRSDFFNEIDRVLKEAAQ